MTKSLKSRYSGGYPWIFDIIEPGYNYRLDELRCALGVSQLKRIKKINQLRKNAASYYNSKLQNISGIICGTSSNVETDILNEVKIFYSKTALVPMMNKLTRACSYKGMVEGQMKDIEMKKDQG